MELPTRLPRERKIIEIYSETETYAINEILSDGSLSKRDKAICLLLLETGLRAYKTTKNRNGTKHPTSEILW